MSLLQKPAPAAQQGSFDNAKIYVWVKGLETKLNNLVREVGVLKNDFITKHNDLRSEMKALREQFVDVGHSQEKTAKKMDLIVRELKQTAGSEEIAVLKKYVDLWNPLNFVTQNDVERIVREMMKTKKEGAGKQVFRTSQKEGDTNGSNDASKSK